MKQLYGLFLKWIAKHACAHRWYMREGVGIVCDLCGGMKMMVTGCNHQFQSVQRLDRWVGTRVVAVIDVMRCTKCGDGKTQVIQ